MQEPKRSAKIKIALSIIIASIVWVSASLGWLQSTVIPVFDQQLRDFYLFLTVDSRHDDAPGLLHLTFDNEALAAHHLPDRVPTTAIAKMLQVARGTQQAIILDVDLATRTDLQDFASLVQYLDDWGQDPDAALLVLAHPQYQFPYRDQEAYRQINNVVHASPNIVWATVGAFADVDGVIRSYEYWSCVDGEKAPMPATALYAWTRHDSETAGKAVTRVREAFSAKTDACEGNSTVEIQIEDRQFNIPREGLIEYQTSIDALDANAASGQYTRDGLPRLMTIGYCSIEPDACGRSGGATQLAEITADRIVLISASNDFSRDEHLTPVGIMSGSLILGNASRALINSGPPVRAPIIWQAVLLLSAITIIWGVWSAMEQVRASIRAKENLPLLRKCLHGLINPAVVQWVAFAAADLMILVYYYYFFRTSGWDGLVGASFGITTVAAIIAFHEWVTTSWPEERQQEEE